MKQIALLQLLFLFVSPLWSQERPLNTGLTNEEQYAFIGMTLEELIDNYGPPRAVSAARGIELWQDDVVFHYTGVDFFIFRDRVWQVRFNTTHEVSIGERKAIVVLKLGDLAEDKEDHLIIEISSGNWPLILRINFSNTEQVNAIFLYRTDF